MKSKKSNEQKLFDERAKFRVYCTKCGYSAVFYPMEHRTKKVCVQCGNYIYLEKKVEFKERLGKLL